MPENPPEKNLPNGQPAGDRITPAPGVDRTPAETPPPTETPPPPPAEPALSPTVAVDPMELAAGAMVPPGSAPPGGPGGPANALPPVKVAPPAQEEQFDTHGTRFDPAIHRMKPDGSPAKNTHGNFYRKDTGRPPNPKLAVKPATKPPARLAAPIPAATFNPPSAGFAALPPGGPPPPAGPDQYDALAETFLQIAYGPAVLILSEEIRTTPPEHSILKAALANWLRVEEMKDLPPGLAFGLVAVGIYLPKFARPTVKQRLGIIWLKIRGIFSGVFGGRKRSLEKPEIEAAPERPRSAEGNPPVDEDPFRE